MSDAVLDQIREVIQRDVNNRGLARDPHDNLFTHCRDDFANACRSIAKTPQPAVAIVTGFFIPHAQPPCGETDGPLGALFLARAWQPLGIKVALITDDYCRRALEIGLQACGLFDSVPVNPLPDSRINVVLRPWPWQSFSTPHLLALERVGPGRDGRCRNMHGRDVTEEMASADWLFEYASRLTPRLTTIGIGDGGNEIGMGALPWETLRAALRGDRAGRIICRIATDHLILSGVSNWGAYGLACAVAALRGRGDLLSGWNGPGQRRLIEHLVREAGAVDGITGRREATVDGISIEVYTSIVDEIVDIARRL